jgi:hypothetical protein
VKQQKPGFAQAFCRNFQAAEAGRAGYLHSIVFNPALFA